MFNFITNKKNGLGIQLQNEIQTTFQNDLLYDHIALERSPPRSATWKNLRKKKKKRKMSEYNKDSVTNLLISSHCILILVGIHKFFSRL